MKSQSLVKRYSQGLLNAIRSDNELRSLVSQLRDFERVLTHQKELRYLLARPFLPVSKKKEVAEAILKKAKVDAKASRFILLLIENERVEILRNVVEFLPDLWNEEQGIANFEVASVVPLTDSQKRKLQQKLEEIEKRPVALKYKSDSTLVGGLCIRKGNIVYDISLKGSLARLQEKIIKGRENYGNKSG